MYLTTLSTCLVTTQPFVPGSEILHHVYMQVTVQFLVQILRVMTRMSYSSHRIYPDIFRLFARLRVLFLVLF